MKQPKQLPVLISLLFLSGIASAAPPKATISGRFFNTMGMRVRVTLSRLDTDCTTPIRHAYPKNGRFLFKGLRDGEYLVSGSTGDLAACARQSPCHLRTYGVQIST